MNMKSLTMEWLKMFSKIFILIVCPFIFLFALALQSIVVIYGHSIVIVLIQLNDNQMTISDLL